jgi:phosphoglycolate phosphatase-like HAD superfamily hydrolase
MNEDKKIDFSNKKYLISDWDGTLVESVENILEAFSTVMLEKFRVKKEDSINLVVKTNGRSLSSQFKAAAEILAGVTIEDSRPYEDAFWEVMGDSIPRQIEGSKEFLEEIKKIGIHVVIWSGTRTDILERQIKALKFDPFIDFFIGNPAGTLAKNKAPLFLQIVDFYKIPRDKLIEESFVFGDGIGDIEAGKEVGTATVGFSNNGKNREKLGNSGADLLVENFEELLERLKRKD